jgi:thiazolylpeptide-type bacteriocin precursor
VIYHILATVTTTKSRRRIKMALQDTGTALSLESMDFDALEISDFLDEKKLSSAEEISNVMAASCTTCECCCTVSTALIESSGVDG